MHNSEKFTVWLKRLKSHSLHLEKINCSLMSNLLQLQARINKEHHILEIGCGWGSLALEVVQKTGCKYTGITLSENQLSYVQSKVKEAGLQVYIHSKLLIFCDGKKYMQSRRVSFLAFTMKVLNLFLTILEKLYFCEDWDQSSYEHQFQDQIELLLCDYRQLPDNYKYDRIIAWWEPCCDNYIYFIHDSIDLCIVNSSDEFSVR